MTLADRLRGTRFGVVLSAGYFGFYGHAGFVQGLSEAGLRPSAWAGSSAGGMIAAYAAGGMSAEGVRALVLERRREDFWDPDPLGIALDAVRGGHRSSGLLRGERFRRLLEATLPQRRFEDLGAPCVLVAADLSSQSAALLDSGDLASAIQATCAYPGLFQAVRRDGSLLWDGGLVDKAPVLALHESKAGRELDALVVHYLPSRDAGGEPKGPLAYATGLAAGFAALRRENLRLQLALLRARGVQVHVVTSHLPPVSPNTMERGLDALAAGRRTTLDALAAPPADAAPLPD